MNYPMITYPYIEDEGTEQWVCTFPGLPGCSAVGDSVEEAIAEGLLAKESWLKTAREYGRQVPEPSSDYRKEYSGTFNLRIGSRLHKKLALHAKQDGISLNQYCLSLLAEGAGKHRNTFENMHSQDTYEHGKRIVPFHDTHN